MSHAIDGLAQQRTHGATAGAQEKGKPPADPDAQAIFRRLKTAARDRPPSYEERMASLSKLDDAVRARKGAIAEAIARDFGSRSKHETFVAEIFLVLSAIKHTKAHLREWMEPRPRETNLVFLPASSHVICQPVGVVGIISPWNYPIQLSLAPLVAAVAAGNRVMIKPSELTPAAADALSGLVADTFTSDQVAVIAGGAEIGEAFSKLPFDHLLFTGSTRVGRAVLRAASENLVPVTLELGGKSPAIVAPDFDLRVAAERIIVGKTFNAGQTCVAPDYALVPATARNDFVAACREAAAKMYPTLAANPDYTSIVNDAHYARLCNYIADAKSRGASIVELNASGEVLDASVRKIPPTLVLDPVDDMLCMQDEIFGPVLPVRTYERLDDAISYVNDHPRPLALYCFSHEPTAIQRVLSETVAGGVTINDTMLHCVQDDLPFGGIGPSGMGHYHGHEGFDAFSHKKAVFSQSRFNTVGLLRPPYRKTADLLLRFFTGE
jgi:coniferyl-aldehyde dehydrogenase